jgi:dihydrofolate reductase
VLTHHTRPSFTLGDTTFHFAGTDPAPVLDRARDAAQGKDARLGGGPTTIRQFLRRRVLGFRAVLDAGISEGRRFEPRP